MKSRITYKPSVDIGTNSLIITARCSCSAGATPAFCEHVFALLHAIEDYVKKELFHASTEQIQFWLEPKPAENLSLEVSKVFKGESSNHTLCSTKFNFAAMDSCPYMKMLAKLNPHLNDQM
ncbi:hypothetical protein TNCT_736671 [Trichonephila clavata]|uniref:SWIM-type domain-containing protein n=1 Tax=Trichonephila clavata TaxID=2740835 RepID=A0A8X6IZX0_TRICU|nr:hypothetical protein TNCT_736671 [Trichonephila clavata]